MDTEETYLEQHYGKVRPFTVPDGYFDTIADRVMARLPEQKDEVQTAAKERRLKPRQQWRTLVSVAACACIIVLAGTWIARLATPDTPQPAPVAATTATAAQDADFDDMADYVMIDNEDIYALVASN